MSMEKNRIRPIAAGKNIRMSYSRQKEVLEMPNLIEVQKDSYKWFLEEGLKEVFDDIYDNITSKIMGQKDALHQLIVAFRRPYVMGVAEGKARNVILV